MKDYTLNQGSKKNYIVDMYLENDGTITVIFADGTTFYGLANTEENIQKIAAHQEKQAKTAITNYSVFRNKLLLSTVGVLGSAGAFTVVGNYISGLAGSTSSLENIGITCATCLVGTIPALVHFLKTNAKFEELKKIFYRNSFRSSLDSYQQYPNALAGVKNRKHFDYCAEHGEDPFSILSIDCFTKDDLETIVDNVEREKKFTFTYQRRNTK